MEEETQTNFFQKFEDYHHLQKDKTLKYSSKAFVSYIKGEKDLVEQQCEHKSERRCMDYDVCHNEMQSLHSQFNQTSRMDYGSSNYSYCRYLQPPLFSSSNSANCVFTKFIHTSINKNKNPVYCVRWTPDGKRLLTGSEKGELTQWTSSHFNFFTINTALDSAVRCMSYNHDGSYLLCGTDKKNDEGYCIIRYFNYALAYHADLKKAHTDKVREISFSPTDTMFVSCSEDRSIKIWDFTQREMETEFIDEHGVNTCDWHPTNQYILSGSTKKIHIWDPRQKQQAFLFSPHKAEVNKVRWNKNGNWFLSCSKDLKINLFDVRMIGNSLRTFERHDKDVSVISWHNIQEDVFCSGSANGCICYWDCQHSKPIGEIPRAHDGSIWDLQWHPVGHMMASCSHDSTTKFWGRDRPNDTVETKKYQGTNAEYDPIIPMYDNDMEINYQSNIYIPNEIIASNINGFDYMECDD